MPIVDIPPVKEMFPGYMEGPKHQFEDAPAVAETLDPEVKQTLQYIKRGDLGIPGHALRAAAFQYAVQCGEVNKEFMLCKKEEGDPRKCLKYNEKVSVCAEDFFRKITDACADSFVGFSHCLERSSYRRFALCRKEQLAFDTCLFEKLGYDKARKTVEADSKVKTDRPKPKNPYNFTLGVDNRNYPATDFYSRPIGKTRDGD